VTLVLQSPGLHLHGGLVLVVQHEDACHLHIRLARVASLMGLGYQCLQLGRRHAHQGGQGVDRSGRRIGDGDQLQFMLFPKNEKGLC
jgi:hypothetical protein